MVEDFLGTEAGRVILTNASMKGDSLGRRRITRPNDFGASIRCSRTPCAAKAVSTCFTV